MRLQLKRKSIDGSAIPLALIFAVLGLLVLTSLLSWTTTEGKVAQRRVQNQSSTAAAEASTENAIGRMIRDFQNGGGAAVDNSLDVYRGLIPVQVSSNYTFNSTLGDGQPLYVRKMVDWGYTNLQSAWPGLLGNIATYRVLTQATPLPPAVGAPSVVGQDLQLAYIPLFAFGIFYSADLEICPGHSWSMTGRVHSNGSIYLQPSQTTVTFTDYVTSAQRVLQQAKPGDPTSRSGGNAVFGKGFVNNVKSMTIPIGTNNSPTALHALIEIPPVSESTNSVLSQQRYYNNADLIILVSDTTNVVQSGGYNGFGVRLPWSSVTNFVDTTQGMYDKREGTWVFLTQIDLLNFQTNLATLNSSLGRTPRSLYVADSRYAGSYRTGIRLVNGQTLPATGLTVATSNPLYIRGNYNAPAAALGTTNTSGTVPASLVADAVTILSPNWSDNFSYYPLAYRNATATTINAALLTGNVPTGGGYYSGGAENAIRLLENWGGVTLTFNGSLAILFYSATATGPWGATADVYNTATRAYNFDPNFLIQAKLPPNTPQLRTTVRVKWSDTVPSS